MLCFVSCKLSILFEHPRPLLRSSNTLPVGSLHGHLDVFKPTTDQFNYTISHSPTSAADAASATLVHSFVAARLDYCYLLNACLPAWRRECLDKAMRILFVLLVRLLCNFILNTTAFCPIKLLNHRISLPPCLSDDALACLRFHFGPPLFWCLLRETK